MRKIVKRIFCIVGVLSLAIGMFVLPTSAYNNEIRLYTTHDVSKHMDQGDVAVTYLPGNVFEGAKLVADGNQNSSYRYAYCFARYNSGYSSQTAVGTESNGYYVSIMVNSADYFMSGSFACAADDDNYLRLTISN